MTPLLTASIGRNIGATPMTAATWRRFNDDVSDVFTSRGYVVTAHAYGRGQWDGVAEDNAVVIACHFDGPAVDVLDVAHALTVVAQAYGQDAIALGVGTSRLIGGES